MAFCLAFSNGAVLQLTVELALLGYFWETQRRDGDKYDVP